MALYESTFITRQDLSRQDVTRLTDAMSGIVSTGGGKIVKTEYWGIRNLAYRIKKNRKGHYAMLAFDAPADAVKELDRNLRINEEIVRFMTVRVEAISEEPSVVLSQGRTREEGEEGFPGAPANDDVVA